MPEMPEEKLAALWIENSTHPVNLGVFVDKLSIAKLLS